jgi:hypothetical protein
VIHGFEPFPDLTGRVKLFVGEMHDGLAGLRDEQQELRHLFAGWQLTYHVRGADRFFVARAPDHGAV